MTHFPSRALAGARHSARNSARHGARPAALAVLLLAAAGTVAAHPGHAAADQAGLQGLSAFAGLAHPLGLDHLLAMLAVGLWSAVALPAGQRLRGPAAFVLAMVAGAALGAWTAAPALVEPGLALSVALFGVLVAWPSFVPGAAGLALVALAGALHGVAHGAELPAGGGFGAYALGFVATTALLHAAGLGLGGQLRALPQRLARWSTGALAGGLGLAGLALLAQA